MCAESRRGRKTTHELIPSECWNGFNVVLWKSSKGEGQRATTCKDLNIDSKRLEFKSLHSGFTTLGKCLSKLPSYTMGIKSQSSGHEKTVRTTTVQS